MLTSLTILASKAWAMAPSGGAEGGAQGGGSGFGMFVPFILMAFVLYFFMIRPQSKKQKLHQEMLQNLKKGDKVLTNGGIIGTVTGIKDNEVTIEIAPQVRVKVNRGYISNVAREAAASAGENYDNNDHNVKKESE